MADFDTLEDAASAAQDNITRQENSSKFEFMSVIFQDPKTNKFRFTDPQTMGDNGKFKLKVRIPKGSLRGIFHNHPGDPSGNVNDDLRKFFSPEDVETAKALGVKSFIGVGHDLLQFDPENPGKRRILKIGGKRRKAHEGEPVLANIATGLFREKRPESDMDIEDARRIILAKTKDK